MGNIQIKDVPQDLHDELRRRAARDGRTMRDYVLDLIRRDQALPSFSDWLDEVEQLEPVELDTSAAAVIDEIRAERDAGSR